MATLQIRKKGVKSWWHYPSDRQPYFLSRLTCIMFGEYLVIREIRDTTKVNGMEIARYHYTDITVFDDTLGGSPETFPNPIALTNRLAQLEYVGFEQGGGGIGFQPNISNPQDGQVILYNEDTGAWENHYIDSQGDRFLTLGTIEVDGNEITLKPTFSWIIQQSEHSYDVDWVNVVPYTSEAGKYRTDIIVATNAGIFIRIQGVEGDVAIAPTVPENTLLVTPIDVFHDSLGDVEPPIVGEQYVKKMGYRNLYLTGSVTTAPVLSEDKRNTVIQSYTGSMVIDGFKDGMPGQPSTLYQGMIVTIDNQTSEEVPLNDMTNSTHPNSDIKMDFRAGISQYTMKPGEVVRFKLRGSVLVFVSSNKAEVDITLEQARQNGNVFEGDVRSESFIELIDLDGEYNVKIGYDENTDDTGLIYNKEGVYSSFFAGYNPKMYRTEDNNQTEITLTKTHIDISGGTGIVFKGMVGGQEFDKQGDRKAFAQIADLEDIEVPADQVSYDNTTSGLDAENAQDAIDEVQANIEQEATDRQLAIETAGFASRTGTEIHFDKWATYDSYSSPSDGNYSYDLTNAVIGMIQVSYHEDSLVPTFSQAGIDVIIIGEYQPDIVNRVVFELIGATRILVNVTPL